MGLSAPMKPGLKPVIATIFRGCLWLDALATYTLQESKRAYLSGLAHVIKGTKQYSQIHVAIFSRENILPKEYGDFRDLSKLINFPIFVINQKPHQTLPKDEIVTVTRNERAISLWISNENAEMATELFDLSCRDDQVVPEAVRVADLIASHVQLIEQSQGFC